MIDIRDLPKRSQRYYTYLEPIIADPLVRGYFGLVASFLLVAFFLLFALSPTINTILVLQKKIAEQKRIVTSLEAKISNLVTAQENYRQVESLIPLLLTALPDKPSPQTAVNSVVSAAEVKKVSLGGPSFKNFTLLGDSQSGLSGLSFSFSVSGSESQIEDYLHSLENSLRYFRLEKLGVSFSLDKITVDAAGFGYYYVQE